MGVDWQDRINPEPNSGCWLWEGAVNSKGYPQMRINGRAGYVHRYVWQQKHGPIPEGMDVLHRCDMPACVNVEHLFLGTHQENMRDMVTKGRHWIGRNSACPRGHLYTPENTRIFRGMRYCRECRRQWGRENNWGKRRDG